MLNRRDLLTVFLGAPLAAAACTGGEKPRIPPGELVGASHAVGHRLRDATRIVPSRWETHDVVIIGAGAAGLAAAWRLGENRPLVLELEPAIGGTSRSGASGVSAFPWGAHYVPAPSAENRALVRLLEEMGVSKSGVIGEEFLCRDPQERIFYRGRWYEGLYLMAGAEDEDLRQLRRFEAEIAQWVAWRDVRGRRAFTIPTALCSDDAEVTSLDAISMKAWLDQRGFTSPRLRWFVEYGCRDDYGALLEDTSAWAGLFYFASRTPTPGEESEPLITWPEGNGRVIKHLAHRVSHRTGTLAVEVRVTARGADIFALDPQPLGIHARRVIIAAPQFVAARLIEAWRTARPSHVDAFEYGSWMVANLTLRSRPKQETGFPLAWDNVMYDSPSLGYVTATHQSGIDYGRTVLTYYYPLTEGNVVDERKRLLSAGREQWADVALTDLERAHPDIRSLTERVDIMRWGHAMIRATPGFIWGAERRKAGDPFGPVHFANTDLSGVPLLEEALYHGVRAAEEVLGGKGGASWL